MHYPTKLTVSGRNKNETSLGVSKKSYKIRVPLVSLAAVFSVVTQYSSPQRRGGALRDNTKNGCKVDLEYPSCEEKYCSKSPWV